MLVDVGDVGRSDVTATTGYKTYAKISLGGRFRRGVGLQLVFLFLSLLLAGSSTPAPGTGTSALLSKNYLPGRQSTSNSCNASSLPPPSWYQAIGILSMKHFNSFGLMKLWAERTFGKLTNATT